MSNSILHYLTSCIFLGNFPRFFEIIGKTRCIVARFIVLVKNGIIALETKSYIYFFSKKVINMSKMRATKPTTKVQPGRCAMQRVQRVSLHFRCTLNTYITIIYI
jgi:hypothetical protein